MGETWEPTKEIPEIKVRWGELLRLVLRRSTCKVSVMSEFKENRNVSTNFSKNPNMNFQENSYEGRF